MGEKSEQKREYIITKAALNKKTTLNIFVYIAILETIIILGYIFRKIFYKTKKKNDSITV